MIIPWYDLMVDFDHLKLTFVDVCRNYYQVELGRLTYGSSPLGNNRKSRGGVIFDTGSSYTYFTNEAYGDLLSSVGHFKESTR